jgi:hypothetical protein
MKTTPRTKLVGVKVTEEEYQRLKFAAKVSAKKPSRIAYELIQKGLES